MIKSKALIIRDFKNELSLHISKNLDKYIEYTKIDFIKEFNTQIKGLTGQDIQNAIVYVYTCYSNKFKQIIKKLDFKVQSEIKIIRYKNNTKNNKIGDLKNFEVLLKSTKLTKCLTYICKYGNVDLVEYLNNRLLTEKDGGKIKYFNDVLYYINKFGFDRLYKLGLMKKSRLINKYNEPIEFTSLSFSTITRVTDKILSYNKNYNSVIKTFITIGGYFNLNDKKVKISIPINYKKVFHGKFSEYKSVAYTVCIEGKRIRFVLAKTGDRNIEEYDNNMTTIGVDINVKHNLFSLSSGEEIDYDRVLFNDYIKFLKHIDEVKTRKGKLKLSKKEKSRLSSKNSRQQEKWNDLITDMLKRKCGELIKYCIKNNIKNLSLEDLGKFSKSFSKNDEFDGFKYTRLINLLNLSDLKNIIKSIAYKNNISVTFVQPEYTSQECHKCGNISKDNRKSQEIFECTECGMKMNADYNSAINIEKRLSLDVLRSSLLKMNKFGEYESIKINKFKLKDIVTSSHSYNNLSNQVK